MNGLRTLAVDPGRTTIGIAVFEGAALRYYAVKTLRVPGTPTAVRLAAATLLNELIDLYKPTQLVIEQPLVVQQRAELLAHVISALKSTARRHRLLICEYAPLIVRRHICMKSKPTKREVAKRLASRYPELHKYTSASSKWVELYYEKMFGAIAVGVLSNAIHKQ